MSAVVKVWTVLTLNAKGVSKNQMWQPTRADANKIAKGLALRNPGKRYMIMEAVATVMIPEELAAKIEELN
jgi:hypothetical protein